MEKNVLNSFVVMSDDGEPNFEAIGQKLWEHLHSEKPSTEFLQELNEVLDLSPGVRTPKKVLVQAIISKLNSKNLVNQGGIRELNSKIEAFLASNTGEGKLLNVGKGRSGGYMRTSEVPVKESTQS